MSDIVTINIPVRVSKEYLKTAIIAANREFQDDCDDDEHTPKNAFNLRQILKTCLTSECADSALQSTECHPFGVLRLAEHGVRMFRDNETYDCLEPGGLLIEQG